MDIVAELIGRVLTTPEDDRGRRHGARRGGSAVPEVPAVPDPPPATTRPRSLRRRNGADSWRGPVGRQSGAARRRSSGPDPGLEARGRRSARADDGALAREMRAFEPRLGQRRMAGRRGAGARERAACWLAEAGTGTGKTLAYLVPAIPERGSVSSSRPARRTCRIRSSTRIFRTCGTRSASIFRATYMKGRRQLPVPAPASRRPTRKRPVRCCRWPTAASSTRSPSGADQTETGDRGRDSRTSRTTWPSGTTSRPRPRTAIGTECPAYQECFVDEDAPAGRRVGRGHRQTITCCAPTPRCARAPTARVIPACAVAVIDEAHQLEGRGDAVLRHRRQQLPARRAVPRRAAIRRRRRRPGDRAGGGVRTGAAGFCSTGCAATPICSSTRSRRPRRPGKRHPGDRRRAFRGRGARPPPRDGG